MKKFAIEIKWGIIAVVFHLLWMVFEKQLGYHDSKIKWQMLFTMLIVFPMFVLYFFGIWEKKKSYYNNQMSWMQGFISAMIIAVVGVILSPMTQFITYEFISPNYFENIIDYTDSSNKLSLEAAQSNFNLSSAIWQNISAGLSTGLVIGALASYLLRTKNTEKEVETFKTEN